MEIWVVRWAGLQKERLTQQCPWVFNTYQPDWFVLILRSKGLKLHLQQISCSSLVPWSNLLNESNTDYYWLLFISLLNVQSPNGLLFTVPKTTLDKHWTSLSQDNDQCSLALYKSLILSHDQVDFSSLNQLSRPHTIFKFASFTQTHQSTQSHRALPCIHIHT